ncbi:hypothetical protein HHK36_007562 [Tetracentron sinense]|uniref:Uncharacterized protein n=1 Tax=Tetracentron sinense TaxID=13715 RepID=A0A834ZJ51_TETSI|nr:hypothetical protein HHK36_007562 [Tetracentron sinense]
MGSCVSVHKNPDSAMRFKWSINSKTDKLLIPSPTKEKPVNSEHPIVEPGFKSQSSPTCPEISFHDFGSKEETFFDSHPWLESDCEDDFFSVNGDFTPSHGNTPIHKSSFIGTPQLNKSFFMDRTSESIPEPSPTDKKKKLAELFRESFGSDQVDDQTIAGTQNIANGNLEPKPTILDLPPKSTNGTPYVSGVNSVCSSERTPNGDCKPMKEKTARTTQCCLPSLVPSCNFNERKKRMTPACNDGD